MLSSEITSLLAILGSIVSFSFMRLSVIPRRFSLLPLLLLTVLFLAGCASPKHRAEKNPEAFASLTEEWQALVLKGKIVEGMTTDALFIAMGKPTWKKPSQFMGMEVMGWVYTRLDTYHIPNYEYTVHSDSNGALYVSEYYAPMQRTRQVPSIVVFVEENTVIGWQDLDRN